MRFSHRATLAAAFVPMALAQNVIENKVVVVEVKTVTATVAWSPQDLWHDHDWQHQDSPPATTSLPAKSSSTPDIDIPITTLSSTSAKMESPTPQYTPVAAAASPAAASPDTSFSDAILNSTNFFRSRFEAAPLTWNQDAANFAQNWASGCVFSHSGGAYGENIAAAWPDLTAINGVDMWGNEEANYNWANPSFSDSTGHFTQLVWQATTSVGCALVACNNPKGIEGGSFLVCEYSPGGNVLDQFAMNVRKPGLSKKGVPGLGERSAAGRSAGGIGLGRTVAAVLVVASMLLSRLL